MADINGDGSIDYEEFMKHFQDMLKMVRFNALIKESLDSVSKPELKPKTSEKIEEPLEKKEE